MHSLLNHLLLVTVKVISLELISFIPGVSDSVQQLVVCALLKFELGEELLVHHDVVCNFLLNQIVSHVMKLELIEGALVCTAVGFSDLLIQISLFL